jgi:hypothetical protein
MCLLPDDRPKKEALFFPKYLEKATELSGVGERRERRS